MRDELKILKDDLEFDKDLEEILMRNSMVLVELFNLCIKKSKHYPKCSFNDI